MLCVALSHPRSRLSTSVTGNAAQAVFFCARGRGGGCSGGLVFLSRRALGPSSRIDPPLPLQSIFRTLDGDGLCALPNKPYQVHLGIWRGLDQAVRGMHAADKELIQAVLRGTLLHRFWGLWLSPLPLHCTELRGKGVPGGRSGREHRQALSVGARGFWERNEKQWGAGCHQPTPSQHQEAGPGWQ